MRPKPKPIWYIGHQIHRQQATCERRATYRVSQNPRKIDSGSGSGQVLPNMGGMYVAYAIGPVYALDTRGVLFST